MTFTAPDHLVEVLTQLSMLHPTAGLVVMVILVIIVALRPLALEVVRMRTCRALMVSCPPGTLLTRTCGRDRILVVAAPPVRPHVMVGAYLTRRWTAP